MVEPSTMLKKKMGLINLAVFHDPEMEKYIPAWHVQHDWIQLPAGGLHDTIDSAWRSRSSCVSSKMDKRGVYYDLPTHVHPKNRQIPCPTLMPHFAGCCLNSTLQLEICSACRRVPTTLDDWLQSYSFCPVFSGQVTSCSFWFECLSCAYLRQ